MAPIGMESGYIDGSIIVLAALFVCIALFIVVKCACCRRNEDNKFDLSAPSIPYDDVPLPPIPVSPDRKKSKEAKCVDEAWMEEMFGGQKNTDAKRASSPKPTKQLPKKETGGQDRKRVNQREKMFRRHPPSPSDSSSSSSSQSRGYYSLRDKQRQKRYIDLQNVWDEKRQKEKEEARRKRDNEEELQKKQDQVSQEPKKCQLPARISVHQRIKDDLNYRTFKGVDEDFNGSNRSVTSKPNQDEKQQNEGNGYYSYYVR